MIRTPKTVPEILKEAKTVAIIGCSPDPYRTSNYAAGYLKERGYVIIPVNPMVNEIMGEKCYSSLNDIPENTEIDIVNIFRNSRYAEAEVQEVAKWKSRTGQNPVVWTQLDVSSAGAELAAEKAELPYIRNKCIMVELDKL